MNKFFIFFTALVICTSCSSDDENDNDGGEEVVSDAPLTGTLQGEAFTVAGGIAFDTSTFDDEPAISINLTNVAAGCDDDLFDFGLRISAIVPNAVGVYTNINIVDQAGDGSPFNNPDQTVEITALSNTEISGRLSLSRETSNVEEGSNFEGTFTIPVCQ